jgi:DNA-binding IscR family transcriptional regulator
VSRSLRPAWEQVRDATITILSGITFGDLAEAARAEPEHTASPKTRQP